MTPDEFMLKRDEMHRVMDDYLCDIENNEKRKKYFEAMDWLRKNRNVPLGVFVEKQPKGVTG